MLFVFLNKFGVCFYQEKKENNTHFALEKVTVKDEIEAVRAINTQVIHEYCFGNV